MNNQVTGSERSLDGKENHPSGCCGQPHLPAMPGQVSGHTHALFWSCNCSGAPAHGIPFSGAASSAPARVEGHDNGQAVNPGNGNGNGHNGSSRGDAAGPDAPAGSGGQDLAMTPFLKRSLDRVYGAAAGAADAESAGGVDCNGSGDCQAEAKVGSASAEAEVAERPTDCDTSADAAVLDSTADSQPDSRPEFCGDAAAGTKKAEEEAAGCADVHNWDDELGPPPPKPRLLWQGLAGLSVTVFGIAGPVLLGLAFIMVCAKRLTLVAINHPVETAVEFALLSLIPLSNLLIWSQICRHDFRFGLKRGLLLGAGIASSLALAGVSFVAIAAGYNELAESIGTNFSTGFMLFGMCGLASAAVGVFLLHLMRQARLLPASRLRVLMYSLAGLVLALLAFVGAEARSWYFRMTEAAAISPRQSERNAAIAELRRLDAERELRMECSDPRSVGIAGLFIPVKNSALPQLYFSVFGRPFPNINVSEFSAMSDEFLKRHVVGERLDKLFLSRSMINGAVSPDSLTATFHWTLVFQNDYSQSREARAEIIIPPDAVVTGLTVWKNGEAQEGVSTQSSADQAGSYYGAAAPGLSSFVTDLGRGRYLVTFSGVSPQEQAKMRISVVAPLHPESSSAATTLMPRIGAANFAIAGEHEATVQSSAPLSASADNFKTKRLGSGEYKLYGTLKESQLESSKVMVTSRWSGGDAVIAVRDDLYRKIEQRRLDELTRAEAQKAREEAEAAQAEAAADNEPARQVVVMIDGSKEVGQQISAVSDALKSGQKNARKVIRIAPKVAPEQFIVKRIKEVASRRPGKVVVVIDGSAEVGKSVKDIQTALKTIAPNVDATVLVASQEEDLAKEPMSLKDAVSNLGRMKFVGGQDNLKAMVKGAEIAGEVNDSVVLWIHGPQPALSGQIYITSPFAHKPSFYELSLDDGQTDTFEYFKHHSEIGPFKPVDVRRSLAGSLTDLFAQWAEGRKLYSVTYEVVAGKPAAAQLAGRTASEVLALGNADLARKLMQAKRGRSGSTLALAQGIVSPVSSLVVPVSTGSRQADDSAEELQGATNGTIGPESSDATVVHAVNTAGTVRVNNLANLEALLNIVANGMELAAVGLGLFFIGNGLIFRGLVPAPLIAVPLSGRARILAGVLIAIAGIAFPGLINWFVASARDANLFS